MKVVVCKNCRVTAINHLRIIHTWAEFARERDLQFFTPKHLENIAEWADDAIALLKEQEAINIDAFVQWCINSHIMGDATVRGIKYWVGKYKEIKKGL